MRKKIKINKVHYLTTLIKWRQYLLDTTEKFEVWIDHKNLKYFKKPHKLNG